MWGGVSERGGWKGMGEMFLGEFGAVSGENVWW